MKYSSILFVVAVSCLGLMSISCEKDYTDCDRAYEVKDYTGLDGCGLVLVPLHDKNARTLEPINIDDFNVDIRPGTSLCITFDIRTDLASICMVGDVVSLRSVTVLE